MRSWGSQVHGQLVVHFVTFREQAQEPDSRQPQGDGDGAQAHHIQVLLVELAASEDLPSVSADLKFLGGYLRFCKLGEVGDPPLRDVCKNDECCLR